MKTLDRYIIRSFLINVALWFVAFLSLRTVADLFINMDEFAKLGKAFPELVTDIAGFYGYQLLVYFAELGGVIVVVAAAFTLARMNHANELTAMLASGVSLYRVIWPIILCSIALGGLIIIDHELVIPSVAEKLVRDRDDRLGLEALEVRLPTDAEGTVWYAATFQPANERMQDAVALIRDAKGRLVASVTAEACLPATIDGTRGWKATGVTLSKASGSEAWRYTQYGTRIYSSLSPERLLRRSMASAERTRRTGGITAKDESYGMVITAATLEIDPPAANRPRGGTLIEPRFTFLNEEGQEMIVFAARSAQWQPDGSAEGRGPHWRLDGSFAFRPSELTTSDIVLRQSSHWLDFMSISQLSALIEMKKVPDRDAAMLAKFVRMANPINNLVMLLLGLPFILSRERNIKASAGLTLLMVGGYYAFIYLCRYVGLSPFWAALLPILLFGPIAVVMLDSVKT
jgi:lipopolysaccharide export LptBFGC system permease protein LptF